MYCKPTHTDQYLQWDSHHSLSAKYSVIGTLTHRAKVVCTDPELLQSEINHLRRALEKCNYPTWAINRVQQKVLNNNWEDTSNNNKVQNKVLSSNWEEHGINQHNTSNNNQPQVDNNQDTSTTNTRPGPTNTIGQVVIPYTQGTAESFKHICGKYGIKVHFKGNTTIKQLLKKPKTRTPWKRKVESSIATSATT